MELVIKYNQNRSQVEAIYIGPTNDRTTYILDLPTTTPRNKAIEILVNHKFDGKYSLCENAIIYIFEKMYGKLSDKETLELRGTIASIRLKETVDYFN